MPLIIAASIISVVMAQKDADEIEEGSGEATTDYREWKPFGDVSPVEYHFPGYFPFACFEPSSCIHFSDLLNSMGNSDEQLKWGNNSSCVVQHEEEANKKRTERE